MRKILTATLIVFVLALMLFANVEAKPKCKEQNWRNPHCRSTATATMTAINSPGPIITVEQTGTVEYVCLSLGCETPGKP